MNALPDQKFQFERHGYFVADRVDYVQGTKPVFNLAVGFEGFVGKVKTHYDRRRPVF